VTRLSPAGWWRGLGGLTRSGSPGQGLSWALYDFANTIYSYAVVSYAMSLWAVDRLGAKDGQLWYGVATAVSVGLNAAISPVLGAMSDRVGRRMSFLFSFTSLCVIAIAVVGLLPEGTDAGLAFFGLALFAVSNFAYQAALIYYDASLPLVARPSARGRMSGIGVAVGYIGTIAIALLILIFDTGSSGVTFLLAAGLFAIFAVPVFLTLRDGRGTGGKFSLGDAARSWSQVATTLRHAREVPGLLRFLIGRFFYTDPANTAIVVMAVFATEAMGMTKGEANMILLVLTVAAVAASFGYGHAVERLGPKRVLLFVLSSWCVGLALVGVFLTVPTFLIGGAILGAGLGGMWTSDRVFMLRLSPPERVGEFFGLYGLAGKFSAVIGPLAYGLIISLLLESMGRGAYQVAILSLLVLMLIGLAILRGVPEPPGISDELEIGESLPPRSGI
jgi:UMF1 family MFS transporter